MKFTLIGLLALTVVGLGGCGNNSEPAAEQPPAAANEPTAPAAATPPPATPPASQDENQAEAASALTLGHVLGEWKASSWTVNQTDTDPNGQVADMKPPPEPHLALTIRQDGTYTLTNTDAGKGYAQYAPSHSMIGVSKVYSKTLNVPKPDRPGVYSGNLLFPGQDKMIIDLMPDHPFTVTITGTTTMVWHDFRANKNSSMDLTWERVY